MALLDMLPTCAPVACMIVATVSSLASETAARTKAFPPGWNGKARTPPLGW